MSSELIYQADPPVYQIVVLDRADDDVTLPARTIRNVTPSRDRSGRRLALLTAAAAAVCAAAGFVAAVLFGTVPPPRLPEPPAGLSSVRSWFASQTPVRIEPLAVGSAAVTPQLAGWVIANDLGGRGLKVELVPGEGPLRTLAIELPAEPRMAMLRGVSSRAFDIEIGSVSGSVRPQDLASADASTFIRHVSVRKPEGVPGLVRVRVNLDAPGQGNLRVVGRTIYADFAARPEAS